MKKWIMPVIGSLAINFSALLGMNYSLTNVEPYISQQDTNPELLERQRKVEEILERKCTPNLQKEVSEEENRFAQGLVEDLTDGHLDSMKLGEYFVRVETFINNRQVDCLEDQWDVDKELADYNAYKDMVFGDFVKSDTPSIRAYEIFNFLQNGIYPYQVDDPKVIALVDKYGERVLDRPFLNASQDGSSWFLKVRKGLKSNCKSGTKWFSALAEEDKTLEDIVYTINYDNHILSVVDSNQGRIFFENTDPHGEFVEPKFSDKAKIMETEELVGEYLRTTDLDLSRLPQKYTQKEPKPLQGLINTIADEYGNEQKVGVRSSTLEEELENIPFGDLKRIWGIQFIPNISQKYDWEKVYELELEKYKEDKSIPNRFDSLSRLFFVLNQLSWINGPSLKEKKDFVWGEYSALFYQQESYWLNSEVNDKEDEDKRIYQSDEYRFYLRYSLKHYLKELRSDEIACIIEFKDKEVWDKCREDNIKIYNQLLDNFANNNFRKEIGLNLLTEEFVRLEGYLEFENVQALRRRLLDTGYELIQEDRTNRYGWMENMLYLVFCEPDGQIERLLSHLENNDLTKTDEYIFTGAVIYDHPELMDYPESIRIMDAHFKEDLKKERIKSFCEKYDGTKPLAQDLYKKYCATSTQ